MGGHIRHLVSFNVKRLYSLLLLRYSVLRAFDESAVCPTTLVIRTPEQNPHGSGTLQKSSRLRTLPHWRR